MSRLQGASTPSEYGWLAFGLLLFALIGYVVASFVGVFVFGLFLYYATRPVYRRIVVRTGHPTVAAAVALLVLALPAILVVGYAVAIAIREIQELREIPGVDLGAYPELGRLLEEIDDPGALLDRLGEELLTGDLPVRLLESLTSVADTALVLAVALIQLFVMVVLAFYLLRDDRKLVAWVLETFDDEEGTLRAYLRAVDYDLRSIFFGNILNAFITGAIAAIVFSGLNGFAPAGVAIPAAALLGLIAGVASLIPVVGMKLVYVPVAIYLGLRAAFLVGTETLWFVGLFLVVSFVFVDSIPDLILRPYVSGRSLHVGAVMLAYTLGPLLFGWYGLFLLPILLVLVVQFARIVLPTKLGEDSPEPPPVDPYVVSAADIGREEPGDTAGGAGSEAVPDDESSGDGTADDGDEIDDGEGSEENSNTEE
ncbi:AI-2E family transporter [Halalkaliarchaeum sp. AArc-GB]|uniref:AI-2E family transporter n=1 Tax=unclassified Halalkaliarchaeum TaxID=2678344 RepID=UPI00217CD40A|nr:MULTISPECIES: AI-2E family transporter [unclassified Halalkaliarchaeum]MDR5673190.1 AI-2E family transporter [Halalkaliarchaeum sp. AArc-GB]